MEIKERLMAEHRQVEELLEEMMRAVQVSDRRGLCEAWNHFDRELEAHMRFEEETLLDRFEEVDPAEARAIRAEHAEIRRLMGELGVGVELHMLRSDIAEQLFIKLRAHGNREEAILYAWAEHYLAPTDEVRDELARLYQEVRLKLHLLGMDARDAIHDFGRELETIGHKSADASRIGYRKMLHRLRQLAESVAPPH
jgi:hypothetical protein